MNLNEAVRRLKQEQDNSDSEAAHANADDILCELLIELGCKDAVDEWCKVPKWYA